MYKSKKRKPIGRRRSSTQRKTKTRRIKKYGVSRGGIRL